MIRVDRRHLKFLLAGRELTIQLDRMPKNAYRRNHVYAVALIGNRRSTCQAQVLEVDGLRIRIKHAPDGADSTTFLARTSGYTELGDPLDAGAVPPAHAVSRHAEEARNRFARFRAGEQTRIRLRSLAIRLRVASRNGDLEAVRAIRAELQEVERDAA